MTDDQDRSETTDPHVPRRRFLATAAAGALAGVGGTQSAAAQRGSPVPQGPTIGLETVAEGFSMPTDFAVPPGSNRRFVLDRTGQISVHRPNSERKRLFLDVSDRMADVEGEQGLLGIAFHPEFQSNGKFYLRYSAPPREETPEPYSHIAVLSEFRASDDRSMVISDSERTLLEVREPQSNHNAGAVAFGPDGYLYVPFGDGGGANDAGFGHASDWYEANEGGNGQDVTENFLGSMLRIDVDSREDGKPYGIPDDNPLVGTEGLDEHFAWGFRNPWRMGFSNGRLFVADVGQNRYEEVDIVRKGANYGWNVREGTHCFSPDGNVSSCPDSTPPDVRGGEALASPIIQYPQTKNGQPIGSAVIGGYVYEGTIAELGGMYVFGDFSAGGGEPTGSLFAATPDEQGLWPFVELTIAGREGGELNASLLAIGRDNAGELYALTAGEDGGGVHKLVPARSQRTVGTGTATGNGTRTTDNETSSTDGAGFGMAAALAGLAGVGYRLLSSRS